MNATKTYLADSCPEGVETYSANTTDAKGRANGARITYSVQVFADLADDTAASWSTVPAGTYYTVNMQATRDGATFGASQADRRFATAEERIAAVDAYVATRGLA